MSLGSFLANAGAGIEDIDVYRTERELRGLQRDTAASQRAALQRAEEDRRRRASLRALGEQFTDLSGVIAPPEAGAAGLLPSITPPPVQTPAPSQAGLDVPAGGQAPTFDIQALRDLEAEVTRPGVKSRGAAAATPTYTRRTVKFAGVDVPGIIEKARPDRLNDGIGRFQRVDPNASDADQAYLTRRNADLLAAELNAMAGKAGYALADWRMSTATQADKQKMQRGEKAAAWYRSDMADRYFRQNPELVPIAKGDPVKFYETVQRAGVASRNAPASKAPARGGVTIEDALAGRAPTVPSGVSIEEALRMQRGAEAPQAGGKTLTVPKPTLGPTLKNGFPKLYYDERWDLIEQQAAARVGVPVELLRAVRLAGEQTNSDRTSPDGARTPYQFIPGTRRDYKNKYGVDAWADPLSAATAAAYHIKESLDRGADAITALREYHGGPDRARWGKHNREYAQRVSQFLGSPIATGDAGTAPQQAGLSETSVAQQPPLNLTNLNSYLGDPTKIGFTASNEIRKREILRQEALIVSQYGTEAEYQQIAARVQEADANLLRLMGAQAIIEVNNFNNPARAQQLLSLMSGDQLQVRMREDGRFAFLARNQQGEFVPVPGQENVSRAEFLSTLRKASDEVYRTQMEQAEAQIAALQVKGQQDIGLEILKSRLRLTEEEAKALLQAAREAQNIALNSQREVALERTKQQDINGKITPLGDGSGRAYLQVQGQTILVDSGGIPIEGSEGLVSGPSAAPITGLPQRTVGIGTGG